MEWVFLTLPWYGVLFFLGIVSLPLTKKIFGGFPDAGYPFSKIFSILFLSYIVFVLGILKILPFTQSTLFAIVFFLVFVNIFILLNNKKTAPLKTPEDRNRFMLILIEELVFFLSFFAWVYVRGQEPSIRSLEKFMDFGFINSILRARYFPPIDMWLSGPFPINYYYFGHLTGATLIKLVNVNSSIGYNLILSTIFGLGITSVFSLVIGIVNAYATKVKNAVLKKLSLIKMVLFGILGSIIVNFGGNLHTIYLFTTGYPNDHPIPFWQILSGFNPVKYWYPNATRFIPFTIHEFPSYSYVVADLHGHVFDIPFVLLTIAILFVFFTKTIREKNGHAHKILDQYRIYTVMFLGFLTAVHYMTNAFDGPIYMLLTIIVLLVLFKFTLQWLFYVLLLVSSFITFGLPFSKYFSPFVNGVGVNCSPQFLTRIGKIGPFLFEKGNCQISPLWMLFVLWGFFWICFLIFFIIHWKEQTNIAKQPKMHALTPFDLFIFLLFSFGTFLIIIPEFFYIKDIYPAHFRANTMFKLGYQAFIMMGIASAYTFFRIKMLKKNLFSFILTGVFIFFFSFVSVYYFFAVPSYYGSLRQPVQTDGSVWLKSFYPEDKEIIDYLNTHEKNQPVILETQGDSYTDFERISAFTGLPTVAGWWVHEWLWRGSSTVISNRIPDVIALYESPNIQQTKMLIRKYRIKYIIVSRMEKQKYASLQEEKFKIIGRLLFRSNNGLGALYKVNY